MLLEVACSSRSECSARAKQTVACPVITLRQAALPCYLGCVLMSLWALIQLAASASVFKPKVCRQCCALQSVAFACHGS